jgi:hypothetical protein
MSTITSMSTGTMNQRLRGLLAPVVTPFKADLDAEFFWQSKNRHFRLSNRCS